MAGDIQNAESLDVTAPAAAIGWNRRWTAVAAVGAAAASVTCARLAWLIAMRGYGDLSPFGHVTFAALFAVFAVLFVAVTVTYALASGDHAPVLVIDRVGVHDRRLSRAPVAWSAIADAVPVQIGLQAMVVLDVDTPHRWPLPANPLWAINRLCARLLGCPQFMIKTNALATCPSEVMAAIAIFKVR